MMKRQAPEENKDDDFMSGREESPPKLPKTTGSSSQAKDKDKDKGKSKGKEHSSSRARGRQNLEEPSGYKRLTIANAELSLEAAANAREAISLLEWSALAKATNPEIVAALGEGRRYDKEKKEKRGQNIGASHVRIGLAMLEALSKEERFLADKEAFKALKDFWETYVIQLNKEQLEEFILIFRVQKPKNPSSTATEQMGEAYAKITFRFKQMTPSHTLPAIFEEKLVAFLRKDGCRVMLGPAPRSGKERKTIALLKGLSIKDEDHE